MLKAPISMIHNGKIWYLRGYKIEPIISDSSLDSSCHFYPYVYFIGIWTDDRNLVQSFDYEEVMAIEPWKFNENVFVEF